MATSSTSKGPLREAEKMRLLSDVTPTCNCKRPDGCLGSVVVSDMDDDAVEFDETDHCAWQ